MTLVHCVHLCETVQTRLGLAMREPTAPVLVSQSYNDVSPLDLQSLTMIELPKRSVLVHLLPVGIGTPLVESMTSYVTRLASIHSVSVVDILDYAIDSMRDTLCRLWGKPPNRAQLVRWIAAHPAALNEGHHWTDCVRMGLRRITCCGVLGRLTAIVIADLYGSRPALRQVAAWCPECFEEWRDIDVPLYEPLIWKLRIASMCPIHSRPLVDACPNCRSSLLHVRPRRWIGYCCECGRWLGLPHTKRGWTRRSLLSRERECATSVEVGRALGLVTGDAFESQYSLFFDGGIGRGQLRRGYPLHLLATLVRRGADRGGRRVSETLEEFLSWPPERIRDLQPKWWS